MEVIDLSRVVSPDTYVLTEKSGYTDPPVRFETWCTIEEKGYRVTEVHLGLHAGTHCDVAGHYVPDGRNVTDYHPSNFVGWAIVLQLKGLGPVTPEMLNPYADRVLGAQDVALVVRNSRADPLTPEARSLLASWKPNLIVSGEGWNLDENYYESDFFHRADIPLVMNPDLEALDEVRDGDFIVALPLRLLNAEGSPIRLIAVRGLAVRPS